MSAIHQVCGWAWARLRNRREESRRPAAATAGCLSRLWHTECSGEGCSRLLFTRELINCVADCPSLAIAKRLETFRIRFVRVHPLRAHLQRWVPAAIALVAPVAASASDLNLSDVSSYASGADQVTSINQFSDVRPTDWAFQALSNLIERYGCVAGYPDGTYRGAKAMTRYEAAALLNACLDRVTEVTDELKRLMKEFEKELAVLRGRVDGLEARVGELEANQFSTTTKLKGIATFVLGANSFGGDARVNRFNRASLGLPLSALGSKLSDQAARLQGATAFNYDVRLMFDTSFTGKDLLRTTLRAGNFADSPWGQPLVGLNNLEVAFQENCGAGVDCGDVVSVNRLFYQFPIGSNITATIGGRVRQDDMLALWPSAYPSDTVLDIFTYAGAPGTYNLNLGAGAGLWWKTGNFSISANYVSANADSGLTAAQPRGCQPELGTCVGGGIGNPTSAQTGTLQIGYAGSNYGLAVAYTYTSDFAGALQASQATPLASYFGRSDGTNSVGISGYWQPTVTGLIPSVSAGWGINSSSDTDSSKGFGTLTSQSWYVGLQWADAFVKGNALGMAVGQPTFMTGIQNPGTLLTGATVSNRPNDGNYAWEWWYKFQVTDNISVTPAIFYLSAPLGQFQKASGDSFTNFGGLVKTTFKF